MSEQYLKTQTAELRAMNKQAQRMVLGLAVFIHILLNVYARMADDDYLKISIPIMSAVSVVVVLLILKLFKDH